MRARRAETRRRAVSAGASRRSWAALFAALLRAQPGPERSGGTRPNPPSVLPQRGRAARGSAAEQGHEAVPLVALDAVVERAEGERGQELEVLGPVGLLG